MSLRPVTLALLLAGLCFVASQTRAQSGAQISAPVTSVAEKNGKEQWKRVTLPEYGFSFAHPEEWKANKTEHPDPDISVDMEAHGKANDFNAIEVNREGAEQGLPYIIAFAIPKPVQTWEEYKATLDRDLLPLGAQIVGVKKNYELAGAKGFDLTYEWPSMNAKVRSIVLYKNGKRFQIMYTVLEEMKGKEFVRQMPRFERLLETFKIE